MKYRPFILTLCLFFLFVVRLVATVSPPIGVELTSEFVPALPNQVYSGTFAVYIGIDGDLSGIIVEGVNWNSFSHDAPSSSSIQENDSIVVQFTGEPSDSSSSVSVSMVLHAMNSAGVEDSILVQRALDLSYTAYEHTVLGIPAIVFPPDDTTRSRSLLLPDDMKGHPSARDLECDSILQLDKSRGGATTYNITVEGVVMYRATPNGWPASNNHARSVEVNVYEVDANDERDLLATDYTDELGQFSIPVSADDPNGLDIQLVLRTRNYAAIVGNGRHTFKITVPTEPNLTADWLIGDIFPSDAGNELSDDRADVALHILTNITNYWHWLADRYNQNIPWVNVEYPANVATTSWYNNATTIFPKMINLVEDDGWSESTFIHEYGHHLGVTWGGELLGFVSYCNGVCESWTECIGVLPGGHCAWCEEERGNAWMEGFSDWFSDFYTRVVSPWGSNGRVTPGDDYQHTHDCAEDANHSGTEVGSDWVEGFVAAVLRDIEDPENGIADIDGDGSPDIDRESWSEVGYHDRTNWNVDRIFNTFTRDWCCPDGEMTPPRTASSFLAELVDRYGCKDLMNTGWALGFTRIARDGFYVDWDTEGPGPVSNLSSSHETGHANASANRIITYYWDPAVDNCTDIGGYAIKLVQAQNPLSPGFSINIPAQPSSYSTGGLDPHVPGDPPYWFTIRAIDATGFFSWDYETYGPIYLRGPIDAEVEFIMPEAGWSGAVIFRSDLAATQANGQLDQNLIGDQTPGAPDATRWSFVYRNGGDFQLTLDWSAALLLDGKKIAEKRFVSPSLDPYDTAFVLNIDVNDIIYGGRHYVGCYLDSRNELIEQGESNVSWSQYVWTPTHLSPNMPITRIAPPDPEWPGCIEFRNICIYNCFGFSFDTEYGKWHAAVLKALDNIDNYDCRLYRPSPTSTGSFVTIEAESARMAGFIDAGIIDGWSYPTGDTAVAPDDVGVINSNDLRANPVNGDFEITHVVSEVVNINTPHFFSMADDEWLKLREFQLQPGDLRPLYVSVSVFPPDGSVHLAWLDDTFRFGSLTDVMTNGFATTGSDGFAHMTVEPQTATSHCLLIWRDPIDWQTSPSPGTPRQTIGVNLTVEYEPADLFPTTPVNWHSPIVPTDQHFPSGSVYLPDSLRGNQGSTFLNLAAQNSGSIASPVFRSYAFLDGQMLISSLWDSIPSGSSNETRIDSAVTIRGGLHTLVLELDPLEDVHETNDSNNVYGEQFVWSPAVIPVDSFHTRPSPPDPFGSLSSIQSGEPINFNCDGMRSPVFDWGGGVLGQDGYWASIAVLPDESGSDVDMALFDIVDGPKGGFGNWLKYSGWGAGGIEYILANFNKTSFRAFDVGVYNMGSITGQYIVDVSSSHFLSVGLDSTYGPFTMQTDNLTELFEFQLDSGSYEITLFNYSDVLDLGFSVHRDDVPFHTRSTVMSGGIDWLEGPTSTRRLNIEVDEAGYYCFAVWKVSLSDASLSGEYSFKISRITCSKMLSRKINGLRSLEEFGSSVASVGRINDDMFDDYVVGAWASDTGGDSSGAVYLFSGSNDSLMQLAYGESPFDQYGYSVAPAGDIDQDGTPDVLAGAPFRQDQGVVYIHSGINLGIHLSSLFGEANSAFGFAVSGLGDVDGDGFPEIVAGAPYGSGNVGYADVYSWNKDSVLYRLSHGNPADMFGSTLGGLGDLDGDSYPDIIVGARFHDGSSGPYSGKVYVYSGSSGNLIGGMSLEGDTAMEMFGWSITDGITVGESVAETLFVAVGGRGYANNRGRVHVYFTELPWLGSPWQLWGTLIGEEPNSGFGWSVDFSPDVSGDGLPELIVGAPGAGVLPGKVYVYSLLPGLSLLKTIESADSGNFFGSSVATAGDVNGDCFGDLLIGSRSENNGNGEVMILEFTDNCGTIPECSSCCKHPGDANNDIGTNVGDAVYMINYVFKGGPPPPCGDEGDANQDCALNVGDAVYLINYVFKSGPAPICGCVG